MKRIASLSLALKGAGALAWLAYTWALTQMLDTPALGMVLTVLALAGLASTALSAGWAQLILREGARDANQLPALWQATGRSLAWRIGAALVPCALLIGTVQISVLLLTIALSIALIALALLGSALRATGHLGFAIALQGIARLSLAGVALPLSDTPEAILTGHLIACLILIPVAIWRSRITGNAACQTQDIGPLTRAQLGQVLTQNMDVIAVALWLQPAEAAPYLVARRIAGSLGLGFDALRMGFAPRLARQYGQEGFASMARHANLFFAGLGATGALMLALSAPWLLHHFGQTSGDLPLFYILLMIHAAPALFGATGMVMTMARLEHIRARILWALVPCAALGMMVYGSTPVPLALCMLTLTLAGQGACAIYLWHRGVVRPIWA